MTRTARRKTQVSVLLPVKSDTNQLADLLPFPTDQLTLVRYMERGLSIRHLFPASGREEGRPICRAELKMVDGQWLAVGMCGKKLHTEESYQRHVKSQHLGDPNRGSLQDLVQTSTCIHFR